MASPAHDTKSSAKGLEEDGLVSKEGDVISFVANDLAEKIKQSSIDEKSLPRSGSGYSVGSEGSTSSQANSIATSISSQFQLSPNDVPNIDPRIIIDLEQQAFNLGDQIDAMLARLNQMVQQMSAISVGCVQTYHDAVNKSCDEVDISIKSMYALMAKCEELNHSMKPLPAVAKQIREVRRLVDHLELQMITDR